MTARVPSTLAARCSGLGGGDVVDRRTVHQVIDIRAQLGDGLVGQPEARLGQLAHQ